ncbi:choice-of-anchor H family protein [Pseudoalteromonas denitrificans]|uniref:GlyGly-CTERM sorting domain-containing protein n=1 Tax=Pseudoalteromonas denitrificans DSM 6059 TaxID=1123010 RepID=A0A1I1UX10_9GAMM|nr:choice-of-anchor H family protein [Pseudoalteromonas denitrificans]SFD74228.1 hypothetical protein SAMN02745724_05335 [Pseudoalteromonas denitrificans DSM 6059]
MRIFSLFIALVFSFSLAAQTKATPNFKVQQVQNSFKKVALTKKLNINHDDSIWFYDTKTILFQDLDQDGYFQNLKLSIDIDTQYEALDVYVDITFINQNGLAELVYTSDLFTLTGDSENDEQELDFQFFDEWPSNYYQIHIRVKDAYSSEVLAQSSQYDFPALQNLPLEGKLFDQDNVLSVYSVAIQYHQDADNDQFYESFTLAIDADTSYGSQNVIADIFIDGQLFYTSNAFTIYADSAADKQYFDVSLQSGFVTGNYDLEVILREAEFGYELHYLNAQTWVNLGLVSLESQEYVQTLYVEDTYVEVEHSSGSMFYILIALTGLCFYRRKIN